MKTISFLLALSICVLLNASGTEAQVTPTVTPTPCGIYTCMNGGNCVTDDDLFGSSSCDCTGTGYQGDDCSEKVEIFILVLKEISVTATSITIEISDIIRIKTVTIIVTRKIKGTEVKIIDYTNASNATTANVTIDGLTPATTYVVRVHGVEHQNGDTSYGDLSDPVEITTDTLSEKECNSSLCYNGGKCMINPTSGEIYCNCSGTGYGGRNCSEKMGTTCYNTTCLNGGQCLRYRDYYEYCNCSGTGFGGQFCERDEATICKYNYCRNGGQCIRDKGFEYCNCTDTGFDGLKCDLRNASCAERPCDNGGSCTDISGDSVRYCTCPENYWGVDCEHFDFYMKCPNISSDDMMFLPRCSLKTTLAALSRCINNQLPYQASDKEICVGNITKTQHCIYRTIGECSGLMCDSIYNYGGADVYNNIARHLYDPESEFNEAIREIFCAQPENGTYSFPEYLFNIGKPVCSEDLIDRLLEELHVYANRSINDSDSCRLLDDVRLNIYNITKSDCDWSKITEALPSLNNSFDPTYFQRLLEMAQEYFLEWRVNGCEVIPVSACDGYCTNGGVCSETFGIPFCACPPGLGGPRCGMTDPTNVCRTAGPNDVEFLPLCTLRNTTEQLIDCVTNMAGVVFGSADNVTCLHGIHQTFTCVGNVIGNCSRSHCPSIYHLPGVGETVKMIVEGMFDPSVMYTIGQYVCSPVPAGGWVQFLGNISDFSFAPICPSVTLNDVVNPLRTLEYGILHGGRDLSSVCRVISEAQDMAYQLSTRCDMSAIVSLLPPGYEVIAPYIQRGISAIQNMLSNYIIPFCKGVTPEPGPGMCPRITYKSSQCEMTDAWMCQRFLRGKELSSWMEQFMVWWRSCSGFAERDWDHWASSMGLNRGDYMYGGYRMSMGEDGFVRMIKANLHCPSYSTMDCYDGWTFTDVLGCKHCYRKGTPGRNTRSLFMSSMNDYQRYMTTMKIYNALRQDCTGSFSGGCGSSTGPPTDYPTATPWPTGSSMPYPYPEGTTDSARPWPRTSSSMPYPSPQWAWTTPLPWPEKPATEY